MDLDKAGVNDNCTSAQAKTSDEEQEECQNESESLSTDEEPADVQENGSRVQKKTLASKETDLHTKTKASRTNKERGAPTEECTVQSPPFSSVEDDTGPVAANTSAQANGTMDSPSDRPTSCVAVNVPRNTKESASGRRSASTRRWSVKDVLLKVTFCLSVAGLIAVIFCGLLFIFDLPQKVAREHSHGFHSHFALSISPASPSLSPSVNSAAEADTSMKSDSLRRSDLRS